MRIQRRQVSVVSVSVVLGVLLGAWAPGAECPAGELKVGDRAPDFTATGLDGNPLKLSSFQGNDGKNIVLVFNRGHW